MSLSAVQICNLALMKVGDVSISALTDSSKEARACNVFYPAMRDELLQSHPWNFALKRADISAQVTTTPAFEWDYAYTLPTNPLCLRVWELYGSEAEWVVEDGELLTNQEEDIFVRYIAQITDTGKFSPAFCNCLAQRLGAELATKLADDKKLREMLLAELNRYYLPLAYELNAMEGNRPKTEGEKPLDQSSFTFQTEGR